MNKQKSVAFCIKFNKFIEEKTIEMDSHFA